MKICLAKYGLLFFDYLEVNTNGLVFASAESYYKKIVGSAKNYTSYAAKCTGEFKLVIVTDLVLSPIKMKCYNYPSPLKSPISFCP